MVLPFYLFSQRHAEHHGQAAERAEGGQREEEPRGEGEDEDRQRVPG